MAANNLVQTRADGLHLGLSASPAQLAGDETLAVFADGLLPAAIRHLPPLPATFTLGRALRQPDAPVSPLLAALLALDAHLNATINGDPRVLPLPGYLAYRHRLPQPHEPGATLRLPPLNPNGHYHLVAATDFYAAIRLDLHPRQKIAGHVRLAVAGPAYPAARLTTAEHRLERQTLTPALIEAALSAAPTDLGHLLTPAQQARLKAALQALL